MMIKENHKVTSCIILIDDCTISGLQYQWDTFLKKTAVNKYYIRLVDMVSSEFNYNSVTYPLLRIDQQGFVALRCPTISGITQTI